MFEAFKKQSFGITKRLLKRDFSGNTGMAIKNSIYQFSTNIVAKFGSIIFVYLILMRYLSEELFGLYSIALATILIFSGFSDLGIGTALVRYVSKKGKKAGGYIVYLAKVRVFLTITVCALLIITSYFISNYYYKKPALLLALMAGVLYIVLSNLSSFFVGILHGKNNFKTPLYREIIFQISRVLLVFIILTMPFFKSIEFQGATLFFIFTTLAFCYLLISIFLFFSIPKYSNKKISKKEKRELNYFILPLSVTVFSGIFFGYIDTIMLGRYVLPEFVAYYQAAFSLISSAIGLLAFSAVLFPIFSRLKGSRLNLGLNKSVYVTVPLSILAVAVTWILAPSIFQFVNFITGRDYSNSILLLRILALALVTDPLVGILTGYHNSRGSTRKVANSIVLSTILNIILNYIFITQALRITGEMYVAVVGAAIATIISRVAYLLLLVKKN